MSYDALTQSDWKLELYKKLLDHRAGGLTDELRDRLIKDLEPFIEELLYTAAETGSGEYGYF